MKPDPLESLSLLELNRLWAAATSDLATIDSELAEFWRTFSLDDPGPDDGSVGRLVMARYWAIKHEARLRKLIGGREPERVERVAKPAVVASKAVGQMEMFA